MRHVILLMLCVAVLLVGCRTTGCESTPASRENVATLPSNSCKPDTETPLDKIAAGDLYTSQAPFSCNQKYVDVQRRPGQDPKLAVAVAISGGGLRAANYALGVLRELESIETPSKRNVLAEVDYFSTVSGGGIAAGVYLADLLQHQQASPAYSLDAAMRRSDKIKSKLRTNFERSLFRAALQPWLGRNEVLHQRLDEVIMDKRGKTSFVLADVFVPSDAAGPLPRVPYWYANSTVTANGAIFPFAPDILEMYGVTGYGHTRDVKVAPYQMPLAVGLTASASYPGGIPPLTLQACGSPDPDIQLFDGGVSDNLGVITALSLLSQDSAPNKLLLVIDAYAGASDPYQALRERLSTVGVLTRASSATLASWRGRHKYVVTAMANGLSKPNETWRVVFLSFDDLAAEDPLSRSVREIGTRLRIGKAQQDDLFAAAKVIVARKRPLLQEVFSSVQKPG